MSSENAILHFTIESKELECPICYAPYDDKKNQPMAMSCGHDLCSYCLEKIFLCPFCKVRIDKTKQHKKSVFMSSLLSNNKPPTNLCKQHSKPFEGYCLQDQTFVCFNCFLTTHRQHEIATIDDIDKKAQEISKTTKRINQKRNLEQLQIKNEIEDGTKKIKRQFDEVLDQEIANLELLRKKFYKEADIMMTSQNDRYEHQLLAEGLVKSCKSKEAMLDKWKASQEDVIAAQILASSTEFTEQETESYNNKLKALQAEIVEKQKSHSLKVIKDLTSIQYAPAKLKKIMTQQPSSEIYSELELDYLVKVLKDYHLLVSRQGSALIIRESEVRTASQPKFNPIIFSCSLLQLSLKCLENLSLSGFSTLCQAVEHIQRLEDLTLYFHRVPTTGGLISLSSMISSLQSLKKFSLNMDLTNSSQDNISNFITQLTSLKNFSSFDLQCQGSQITMNFDRNPAAKMKSPFEALEKFTINLDAIQKEFCESLCLLVKLLDFTQAKNLKTLKITFGGRGPQDPQVLEALFMAIKSQINLEELNLTSDDVNHTQDYDLLQLLSEALVEMKQLKSLHISLNQPMPNSNLQVQSLLQIITPAIQDLQELTLKTKAPSTPLVLENFLALSWALSGMKELKKLALKYDGYEFEFFSTGTFFYDLLKLQKLVSLDLEFVNFKGNAENYQRDYEQTLSRLPSSVTKKFIFKKASAQVTSVASLLSAINFYPSFTPYYTRNIPTIRSIAPIASGESIRSVQFDDEEDEEEESNTIYSDYAENLEDFF